ncbi:MAG TPA: hypothetical protein VKS01_01325 [Bryobacteraceae bacterium]|nr:hypothetical protein [Bryobacteraceae bacterium]
MGLAWKSIAIGFVLVVLISIAASGGAVSEHTARSLLSPGMHFGALLGFGPHDFGLILAATLFDIALYSAAIFAILWIARRLRA